MENYIQATGRAIHPEVLNLLKTESRSLMSRHAVIADIASGTGIWTRLLLENGNPAFGVEPNAQDSAEAGEADRSLSFLRSSVPRERPRQ